MYRLNRGFIIQNLPEILGSGFLWWWLKNKTKNMKTKSGILFITLFVACQISFSQTTITTDSLKVQNIIAFAKLYGYVRYFHPSDEANSISWSKFAIYGVKKVENAKNSDELITILDSLFKPIAPSIILKKTGSNVNFELKSITPANTTKYKTIAWQHKGIDLGANYNVPNYKGPYQSIRVNKVFTVDKGGNDYGIVMTSFIADTYKGKEIKMTGNVRLLAGSKGNGMLFISVVKNDGQMGFYKNMQQNPVISNTWGNYELTGTIDTDAKYINLGCLLIGKGELYADDIKLFYKKGDTWLEIPIKNNDFESEKISADKTTWASTGKEYDVSITDKDFVSKKRCASIKYIGKIEINDGKPIFNKYPIIGEVINKEIGMGITCIVPLALYGNKDGTYPTANKENLQKLIKELEKINFEDTNNVYIHLGDLVITWNIFKHFYPYFDICKADWNKELSEILYPAIKNVSDKEFLLLLEELTAHLKDGHIWIYNYKSYETFYPPIVWEWIENKLVITQVLVDTLKIHVGDIVEKIDNQISEVYFQNIKKYISASTEAAVTNRAEDASLSKDINIPLNLELSNGLKISLDRNLNSQTYTSLTYYKNKIAYKFLADDIVFLDFRNIEMDTIDKLLPKLINSKYIICDLRGYPKSNSFGFIRYLLVKDDTAAHIFNIPEIIYPNYEKLAGFESSGWELKAKTPHINSKIIFLTDVSAISYAESFLGFIEGYKLATIIGQPTAGTNGDLNNFTLPVGYYISFTGMKVLKLNGSQHHGIGITPDIYVNKTIKGVTEGRDEYMERAMEYIKTEK
jgi:hypothetical protein